MKLKGNPHLGQRVHLVNIVRILCESLQRPICSKDIRAFLSDNPDSEYSYIQAAGQTLLKASIRYATPRHPPLIQVGLCQYHAYYAPDSNPKWMTAFQRYRAQRLTKFLIHGEFLSKLDHSDDSPFFGYSRQILAEYLQQALPFIESEPSFSSVKLWLQKYESKAGYSFSFIPISRQQALALIKSQVASRAPYLEYGNLNRHLEAMSPTILREPNPATYSTDLVTSYCTVHWPNQSENSTDAARFLAGWILIAASHSLPCGPLKVRGG